jgi:hypothetical protein
VAIAQGLPGESFAAIQTAGRTEGEAVETISAPQSPQLPSASSSPRGTLARKELSAFSRCERVKNALCCVDLPRGRDIAKPG